MVLAATIGYALTLLAAGLARSVLALAPFLLLGGFAQMAVISSLNIAAQRVLPAWVRGRGLAVYMLTFQLALATGAVVWGAMANRYGITVTLTVAATVMLATTLLGRFFRLSAADLVDTRPAYHPEPFAPVEVDPDDGPVLIITEYRVPPELLAGFTVAARRLRGVRRREGAIHEEQLVERSRIHRVDAHERLSRKQMLDAERHAQVLREVEARIDEIHRAHAVARQTVTIRASERWIRVVRREGGCGGDSPENTAGEHSRPAVVLERVADPLERGPAEEGADAAAKNRASVAVGIDVEPDARRPLQAAARNRVGPPMQYGIDDRGIRRPRREKGEVSAQTEDDC